MQGINICIKSREAPLADFKISIEFFGQMSTIWNYDEKSAFAILYSHDLMQNH